MEQLALRQDAHQRGLVFGRHDADHVAALGEYLRRRQHRVGSLDGVEGRGLAVVLHCVGDGVSCSVRIGLGIGVSRVFLNGAQGLERVGERVAHVQDPDEGLLFLVHHGRGTDFVVDEGLQAILDAGFRVDHDRLGTQSQL